MRTVVVVGIMALFLAACGDSNSYGRCITEGYPGSTDEIPVFCNTTKQDECYDDYNGKWQDSGECP